jgi:hypothetical protein
MSPATIFLTSRPRLGPVAAPLRRVCLALTQVGGPGPSAARHSHSTQLPLFFRLVFIHPGVVGSNLPAGWATFAAYGMFATGLLAMLAPLTIRIRPLFWALILAFNVAGAADIIVDYYHGIQLELAALSGELGAAYWIPILYLPTLVITHVAAFYLLVHPQPKTADGSQPMRS